MKVIRKAEREIGYIEGDNLCDYELLWGVYCWMANNIDYGTPNVYSNQSV